jgi:hypothetical protein
MAAVLTFENLIDQVLHYLDQAGETGTPRDVISDAIKRVHKARLTERKWNFMRWDSPQTITTMVGQKFYSLHQEFFRPVFFYNRTIKRTMEQVTDGTLLPAMSGLEVDYDTGFGQEDWTDSTGSAYRFILGGVSPVKYQPSSASVITVAGESAKTVTVKGETSDGDVASETITVGTPGTIEFTKILQVVKGDGWTATMTMTSNGGAVTNLTLRADEVGRQYRQLELLNEPDAVETIIYKFYRKPCSLDTDNAIPDIPAEFVELLVYDALLTTGSYNRNIDSATRALWTSEQQRLEQGLLEYDEGPDALGAAVQYQSFLPRD